MVALCNRADHYILWSPMEQGDHIYFHFIRFLLSFFLLLFFPRLISAVGDWMSTILRLAGNTGRKKVAKNRHLGTIAQLCRAISSTIGKNLLSSNTSSTCPDNMVNFGLLTAEICWRVWGTPTNFNGFCVLAALLHDIQQRASAKLCGVEQRALPMFGRATIRLGIGPHVGDFFASCISSEPRAARFRPAF